MKKWPEESKCAEKKDGEKRENALSLAPVKGVWPNGRRICRGKASLTEWSWFRFVKGAVSGGAAPRRRRRAASIL